MKILSADRELASFHRQLEGVDSAQEIQKLRKPVAKRFAIGTAVVASALGIGWWAHRNHEPKIASTPVIYPGQIAQDAAACPAVGSRTQIINLELSDGQPMSDYQAYVRIASTNAVQGFESCSPGSAMARIAFMNSGEVMPDANLAAGTYTVPYAVEPK